jgi:hypothetical protein
MKELAHDPDGTHGGASLVFLNQLSVEFSFITPSAPPLTYTFKLTRLG